MQILFTIGQRIFADPDDLHEEQNSRTRTTINIVVRFFFLSRTGLEELQHCSRTNASWGIVPDNRYNRCSRECEKSLGVKEKGIMIPWDNFPLFSSR